MAISLSSTAYFCHACQRPFTSLRRRGSCPHCGTHERNIVPVSTPGVIPPLTPPTPKRVAITLQLEVTTDMDPEELGFRIATNLAAELNESIYPEVDPPVERATCQVTDTATVWLRK